MGVKLGSKLSFFTILKRVFIGIFIFALIVLIVGYLYELYFMQKTTKNLQPQGKLVNINGCNIHVFAQGKGDITVVFAAGNATPSPYADFYGLYSEISKHTRTVVYERPGYGFSESTKDPRDINNIVFEMRESFMKAGEKAPYVFVAHSLATLEVFRYSQLYPSEVKGIILIDGGSPSYYYNNQDAEKFVSQVNTMKFLKKFGLFRLQASLNKDKFYENINGNKNMLSLLPTEYKELNNTLLLKYLISNDALNEVKSMKKNAQIVLDAGLLGDLPLKILTAEVSAERQEEGELKWLAGQKQLLNWSTNSEQKIVTESDHFIHQYKPEVINKEILSLLNTIK